MAEAQMGRHQMAQRGRELYADHISAEVEREQSLGKMIVIDVETGDYEVGPSGLEPARRLCERRPNAELYGIRIGYRAPDTIGGAMEGTTSWQGRERSVHMLATGNRPPDWNCVAGRL
jgi:hypothetical protein